MSAVPRAQVRRDMQEQMGLAPTADFREIMREIELWRSNGYPIEADAMEQRMIDQLDGARPILAPPS